MLLHNTELLVYLFGIFNKTDNVLQLNSKM